MPRVKKEVAAEVKTPKVVKKDTLALDVYDTKEIY